ncbi:MAG: hypothetical protein ACJ8AW_30275 [Rhodopila sp.]
MIRHQRVRPPLRDYPADEWNVVEKHFYPELLAQTETILALGNGYIGMRGCPEEGGPHVENSTLINGFYESRPILYGEEAYGFAKMGQTILNVTDSKIIRLYVDDEPFWLPSANILRYDRRLNMQAGTLDREVLWETPAGKQVLITSRRLVSFVHRHVAAISYRVVVLNAAAPLVIASEMATNQATAVVSGDDPRQTTVLSTKVLRQMADYSMDRRIAQSYDTQTSGLRLACGIDHVIETSCRHDSKISQAEDFGRVAFSIEAEPGAPVHLVKYMTYHTSQSASTVELCARADWTLDRAKGSGFADLLASQEQYLQGFWRRSDVHVNGIQEERTRRSTVEIQQAIRFNLFHIIQASARADDTGVAAKGLTGQAYEGHYFWDAEIYLLPH